MSFIYSKIYDFTGGTGGGFPQFITQNPYNGQLYVLYRQNALVSITGDPTYAVFDYNGGSPSVIEFTAANYSQRLALGRPYFNNTGFDKIFTLTNPINDPSPFDPVIYLDDITATPFTNVTADSLSLLTPPEGKGYVYGDILTPSWGSFGYATVEQGTGSTGGVIYRMSNNAASIQPIFQISNDCKFYAGLTEGQTNILYGWYEDTSLSTNIIFNYNVSTSALTQMCSNTLLTGYTLYGELYYESGKLYGVRVDSPNLELFEFNISTSAVTIIDTQTDLATDLSGGVKKFDNYLLYLGQNEIYSWDLVGNSGSTVHTFNVGTDGNTPYKNLIRGDGTYIPSDILLGVTFNGGSNPPYGTIYSLTLPPAPPQTTCSETDVCINLNGTPLDVFSGIYSNTTLYYNGYNYFTGQTTGYFIYYSLSTDSWCLSTTLGGSCDMFGQSPCLNACPDLDTSYFITSLCPTPTPTPTPPCELDFGAILDCDFFPSPTSTPTNTTTPTTTPTPSSTDICGSFNAEVCIDFITPSPSSPPNVTPTPTSTGTCSNIMGIRTFNNIDDFIICSNEVNVWKDCVLLGPTPIYWYSYSPAWFNNAGITTGQTYLVLVNGLSRCVTYQGVASSPLNGAPAYPITIVDGPFDCNTCAPVPSFTPTSSLTPSPTPTMTNTPSRQGEPNFYRMYYYSWCNPLAVGQPEVFIQSVFEKPNGVNVLVGQTFAAAYFDSLNSSISLWPPNDYRCFRYLGTTTYTSANNNVTAAITAGVAAGIIPPNPPIGGYNPTGSYFQNTLTTPTGFGGTWTLTYDTKTPTTAFVDCSECLSKHPPL